MVHAYEQGHLQVYQSVQNLAKERAAQRSQDPPVVVMMQNYVTSPFPKIEILSLTDFLNDPDYFPPAYDKVKQLRRQDNQFAIVCGVFPMGSDMVMPLTMCF